MRAWLVVVALALAACGGGGGGGSTTPSVPGPNGAPSSQPTSTPGPTPTPAPTPPPTQGSTILPDTHGRIGLIQILDGGVVGQTPMPASEIQPVAQDYDSVWGSFQPQSWSSHPGMILSRYMIPVEDENLVSQHDLTWWQANHPDWILYACDANGNPTKEVAYSGTGFADVPLDFHNPGVIAYQLQTLLIPYMRQNGYNALAADNTDLLNYTVGPNPVLGEGSTQSGWYGCGIWQGSTFVRRYGSQGTTYNRNDPAFVSDMINWIKTAHGMLSSAGMHLLTNHPLYSLPSDPNEAQVLANIDGMIDENGFTHYGDYAVSGYATAGLVSNTLTWMEAAQSQHVAFFVTDYFCENGKQPPTGAACSTDPNTLTAAQVDWALATYAIGNEGGANVFISPKGGDVYSFRAEYTKRYGAPCSAYKASGSLYYRQFAGGFAVANAGSSAQSMQLPVNHVYTDIEGRPVSNPLLVNSADGYLLLTSGNGCS